MTEKTRQQLLQINKEFYTRNAKSFSDTRQSYWPGWEKAWEGITLINPHPAKILDVGCGNGRFLDFLQERHSNFEYLGIDSSAELIKTRVAKTGELIQIKENSTRDIPDMLNNDDTASFNFKVVDLSRESAWTSKEFKTFGGLELTKRFDLIVSIAVFHHIPGRKSRSQLLKNLQELLMENGLLLITFWDFKDDAVLSKKIIPWENINLKPSDVEGNDHLLGWGGDNQNLRYCHYFDEPEKEDFIENSQMELINSFRSDGRNGKLNRYFLLRKV